MALGFKTIVKDGLLSFVRNPVVSIASILVMCVSLFFVGSVILINASSDFMLKKLANNIDISVYLEPNADEEAVSVLIEKIKDVDGVGSVIYKDPDEVFSEFVLENKEDVLTLQSLKEFQGNPFGGVIIFRMDDVTRYGDVADEVFTLPEYQRVADWTDFYENADVISKTYELILKVKEIVLWAMILLVTASVLITFSMFGVSIHSFRDEIHTKKLIGAGYSHLRGPFVVQGILYGLISGLIASVMLTVVSNAIDESLVNITGGFSVFNYISTNILEVTAILIGFGVVIGVLSSFISVSPKAI